MFTTKKMKKNPEEVKKAPFEFLNPQSRPKTLSDKVHSEYNEWLEFETELVPNARSYVYRSLNVQDLFGYDLYRSVPKDQDAANYALDISCGWGARLLYMRQLGWQVAGTEMYPVGNGAINELFKPPLVDVISALHANNITYGNVEDAKTSATLSHDHPYKLITAMGAWRKFQDPLGTLVEVYNNVLATDGFLIICDSVTGMQEIGHKEHLFKVHERFFQTLKEQGYSFAVYEDCFVLKKTAATPRLNLPYQYDESHLYALQPEFKKTPAIRCEANNREQFFAELTQLGMTPTPFDKAFTEAALNKKQKSNGASVSQSKASFYPAPPSQPKPAVKEVQKPMDSLSLRIK